MTPATAETAVQLQYTEQGGAYKIVNVPKPTVSGNEVLIRQRVVALNLVDIKQRDLGVMVDSWPRVLGIEGAGVVEAVGPDVKFLQIGDEVSAWQSSGPPDPSRGAAFQEFVVAQERFVAKKPKNITLEEAASLPICFTTAVCCIVNSLNMSLPFLEHLPTPGKAVSSVLILGGSSATGAAVIQLLRTAYPSLPILATSSEKHHAHVTDLGATRVLDYKSSSIVADIKAASPNGAGVDVILDCVAAGASQMDISDVLDPAGSKKYVYLLTGIPISVPEGIELVEATGWSVMGMHGGKQVIPSLTRLVEEGLYRVPLPVRVVGHGLEELPKVLDEAKTISGEKLLVTL